MQSKSAIFHLMVLFCFYSCHSSSAKQQPNIPVEDSVPKNLPAKSEPQVSHGGVNVDKPERNWVLPASLKEISGNTWIDKNHLLVIEDLHPILYVIRLDKEAVIENKIPFEASRDKKFDIEDVVLHNNVVYALWSHGTIFKITEWQTKPAVKEITTFLNKKNNTEGICYDPVSGNLLIACKNLADNNDDEKKSTRAVYEFDTKADSLKATPVFLIHKKDFKQIMGESLDFYPSAIAVHPLTKDIYILSSKTNKCIARFSHEGKLKSVQFIDSKLMPQPEGICFSPEGTMYISSEGKDSNGKIYQFNSK